MEFSTSLTKILLTAYTYHASYSSTFLRIPTAQSLKLDSVNHGFFTVDLVNPQCNNFT